jgi:ATP/maltotriose-dependent transcriptional regulator MalT
VDSREVQLARSSYDAREWARAYDYFVAAEQAGKLAPTDLERYAVAAMLLGRMDEYFAIRERCFHQQEEDGDLLGCAQSAVWIGMQRMVQGEVGPGTGWLARATRIAREHGGDSVPSGYLVLSQTFEAEAMGDLGRAVVLAAEAVEAGRRLGERDLVGLALHRQGLLLLAAEREDEGLRMLDEAMVCLTAGELSPMVTGIVYCGVIAGCWTVYELRRAQQWTAAMTQWCDSQPDLANFTGECKVRRAELKQLQGKWPAAREELAEVRGTDVDLWAAGAAAYVRGNLDRLQGRYDAAADEFREAARLGFEPQPGLALLRLASGSVQAAAAMVRRTLAERSEPGKRVELLCAATEILLALGETTEARRAVDELPRLARNSPIVQALGAQARARVDLAEGEAERALGALRSAVGTWVRMGAPYEEARVRVLLADACRAVGDKESADRELSTARGIFSELGAAPDLASLASGSGPLTVREREVLRLLATGATNKAIAAALVLSERTVDRHVSNIFGKLGVSSRAAATAYAYEHDVV